MRRIFVIQPCIYANCNVEIAQRLHDMSLLNVMKIKKANILGKTGLYGEGVKLLHSIGKSTLTRDELAEYYATLADISLYRAEYAVGTEYNHAYLKQLYAYRDSVLDVAKCHCRHKKCSQGKQFHESLGGASVFRKSAETRR